jgi:hypothetical protein
MRKSTSPPELGSVFMIWGVTSLIEHRMTHGDTVVANISRADVTSTLTKGLSWLSANRRYFAGGESELDPQQPSSAGFKALGEIALMLFIIGRAPGFAPPSDYGRILETFCAIMQRVRPPIETHVSCLRIYMNAVLAVEANGIDGSRFRDVLDRVLRQPLCRLLDQSPWGISGLSYFLDHCGIAHSYPPPRTIYELSILRSRPQLHLLSTLDKYAVTHLLFFLGDFGRRSDFFRAMEDARELREYLDELTASAILEEDWDLLGEFLIGYECIAYRASPLRALGWQELLAHQRLGGEIELPRRVAKAQKDVSPGPSELFSLYYHQTLVALMASTLVLQPDE